MQRRLMLIFALFLCSPPGYSQMAKTVISSSLSTSSRVSGLLLAALPVKLELRPFAMLTEQVEAQLLKISVIRRNSKSLWYRGQDRFLPS